MSDSSRPSYVPLNAVITTINPTAPPRAAVVCENFRVMPSMDGNTFLRLMGGRKSRAIYAAGTAAGGEWQQFHEFRDPFFAGFLNHFGQKVIAGVVKWYTIALSNWLTTDILTIDQTLGGTFTQTGPAPVCNLDDAVAFYNGLGSRTTDSKPAFSLFLANEGRVMYLGLDCFVPPLTANPSVATGAGGAIEILFERQIYVGLYNIRSGHFSNVVSAGLATSGVNRRLTISNLNNIKPHWHDAAELNDLRYVFYASVDLENATIGYLMMDPADETLPLMKEVPANLATATSIVIDNFVIHVDKEAPTENHPPRPMRWVTYVNGRIYGTLAPGGVSPAMTDFSYVPPTHYLAGITWSAAASDLSESFFLGAPEHAFPLDNFKATPNTEMPLIGGPAPDGESVHLVTPSTNYTLYESTDELHIYTEIEGGYGIKNAATYITRTNHGTIWETQRGQIVALSRAGIVVLSRAYQDKLRGKTSKFARYVSDPANAIDRYELHFTDGTMWIHDFTIDGGYAFTWGQAFTAGKTLINQANIPYHILATRDIYTDCGQPEDTRERVRDENTTTGAIVTARPIGTWENHWDDFGDPAGQGNIAEIHIHGDVRGGNLLAHFWKDHQEVLDETIVDAALVAVTSSVTSSYMATIGKGLLGAVYALKARLKLTAHVTETTYPTMAEYGRGAVVNTMLGIIGRLGYVMGKGKIRAH